MRKFAKTKNMQKYKFTDSQNYLFCIHSASQRAPVHDKQRHIYVHRMNECKNDRDNVTGEDEQASLRNRLERLHCCGGTATTDLAKRSPGN